MKPYAAPVLTDYGDVNDITATLGDPFTGDASFDLDGNIIDAGMNSINQCSAIVPSPCEVAFENGTWPP